MMTLPEQQYLQQELRRSEEIRWRGRPAPELFTVDTVMSMLGGVLALAICAGWVWLAREVGWGFGLCSLPAWWGTYLLLSAPWRHRRRLRRTLLLVTTERVMLLYPGWTGRVKMDGWKLRPGLLQRYTVQEDGSGDLIFGYNMQVRSTRHTGRSVPFGLQAVPDVEHVATLIQELCKNNDDAR